MRFVAIDVETANPNMSSICQIGIVHFKDCKEIEAVSRLVDPQTYFDPINVSIHGICEGDVCGEATFEQLHDWLAENLSDRIVVCHTHFDRIALSRSCQNSGMSEIACRWLDSARVTRRAWPQFSRSGYGLANVAEFLGIKFQHHDALSDARAAGLILMQAMLTSNLGLDEWLATVNRPITPPATGAALRRLGDGDGALVGESIVFTGALALERRDAADRAAIAGADVQAGVNKRTTMLVVGDQDIDKLAGKSKSNKHLKAEHLIEQGCKIRIVGESDFMALSSITS